MFVKEAGPLEEKGMVMNVLDKAFDVLVLKLGVTKRVYCEQLTHVKTWSMRKVGKRPEMTLTWKADDDLGGAEVTQTLTIFSVVHAVLTADEKVPLKYNVSPAIVYV